MTCPTCGAQNPPGFRFCGACAAPLSAVVCRSCATPATAGQRFCGACGAPLADALPGREQPAVSAETASLAGERRIATVLFADVVGFTTLAETADPEQVATAIAAGFRRLGDIVRDHGGTVNRYIGDCLMAVFGVPTAHDDDAERAVAAALAIRDAAGDLTYSIGVNTGEVMVTAMPGDERVTVIGDAVNVAARLQSAAGRCEVLVGPLTARLCGGAVRLSEREAVVLRGRSEPVAVFEALGAAEDSVEPAPDGVPLVGREAELDLLLARWRRCVAEGRADLVLVAGDVGTGKTRLVAELARVTGARAVSVTYPAFGTLAGARVVAGLLGALGPTGDPRLDSRLRSLAGEAVPEMASLDAAAVEREQRLALRRLLEMRAAEEPLLVCIDEAQRAPARTLDIVEELAARLEGPVLLVAAGRPEPAGWLARFTAYTHVRLDPLGRRAAAELAASLVSEGRLDPAAAEALATHGAGNPLHLRELVRLVRDGEGFVAGDGGLLGLRGGLSLPPSLHAVLTARLDQLSPEARQVAQHTALLGDGATVEVLTALAGVDAAPGARALVAAGVAREREDGALDLLDPLLREVAYELLPRRARATLHRRAAAIAHRDDDRARHLEAALSYLPDDDGLRAETAVALEAAGLHLLAIHRPQDSAEALQRARSLGATSPAGALALATALTSMGRDREALTHLESLDPAAFDPRERAEWLHAQANALTRLDPVAAITRYDEVRPLWTALGDASKEAWAIANAAVAATYAGQVDAAIERMGDALERFGALGDRVGIGAARPLLGMLLPDDPRVPGWMEESLAWAREDGDPVREHYALMSASWWHVLRSWLGGVDDVGSALACLRSLHTLSRELRDVTGEVEGIGLEVLLRRFAGDIAGARAAGSGLAGLLHEADSGFTALVDAARFCLAVMDDPAAPTPASARTPRDSIALFAAQSVAQGLVLAGRPDEVAELLGAWRDEVRIPALHTAGRGTTEALVDLLEGRPESAASRLVAAAETAGAVAAGPLRAMALALLAEAVLEQGDAAGAEAVLAAMPEPRPGGIAGAAIVRVEALLGRDGARARLELLAAEMVAPGLLLKADCVPAVAALG